MTGVLIVRPVTVMKFTTMKHSMHDIQFKKLTRDIYSTVAYYVRNVKKFSGPVLLRIDCKDYSVGLVDAEPDTPDCVCFDVNRLVSDIPDGMIPDDDKIATLATEFYVNA